MSASTIRVSTKIDEVVASLRAGDRDQAIALGHAVDELIAASPEPLVEAQRWSLVADLLAKKPVASLTMNASSAYGRGAWAGTPTKKTI